MTKLELIKDLNQKKIKIVAGKIHKKDLETYLNTKYTVDAGLKDMIKKAALLLAGTLMFSDAAQAFHFKPERLKHFEHNIKEVMQDYNKEYGDHIYDFKIKEEKKGGFQQVKFNIMKDGKVAGVVTFTGTIDDSVNNLDGGLTEGKGDEWVKTVLNSTFTNLNKIIEKKVLGI